MANKPSPLGLTFWGTRGSYPCSGKNYAQYGGNTSCVEYRVNNELLIFDAGTGLISLGNSLKKEKISKAHLLLTHFHLDHLLGFPFFPQLWDPSFRLTIYSGTLEDHGGVEAVLSKLIAPPWLPFRLQDFKATIEYKDFMPQETWTLGTEVHLSTYELNHPNRSIGYRVIYRDQCICYITDTEYNALTIEKGFLDFIQESDVVIFDAAYTEEEYQAFKGWGHTTWQQAVEICERANVKKLVLYHQAPHHTDIDLNRIAQLAKDHWSNAIVAYDGLKL